MGVSADENFHGREKEGLLGSVVGDDEAKKSRKSRGEKEGANLIEGHTPEADELGEKARHKPHQFWNLALLALTFSCAQSTMAGHLTISPLIVTNFGYSKLATVPVAGVEVGAMIAAWVVGYLMQKKGRKIGFIVGEVLGVISSCICMAGILNTSLSLLVIGGVFLGCWSAAAYYARFVAAEVVGEALKGRAVSWVLVGCSICASVGPTVATQTAGLFGVRKSRQFLAFYLIAGVCALISIAMALALQLQTVESGESNEAESGEIGEEKSNGINSVGEEQGEGISDPLLHETTQDRVRSLYEISRPYPVRVAILGASSAMLIMMLVMSATSLAMHHEHNYNLTTVSTVIQLHVASMFLPCFFTGEVIERLGKVNTMIMGCIIFSLSVITGIVGSTAANFYTCLILLGIGWNFLFLGGTRLLVESVLDHRLAVQQDSTRIEGLNEVFVQGFGALGALGSGYLVSISWHTVLWTSIPVILVNICALLILVTLRKWRTIAEDSPILRDTHTSVQTSDF
ncbi:hypothetical protein AAMO2058_001391200 [Amorphochlora amoebiformis]